MTLPARSLVNGQAVGSISVTDRGLHYGDGLFETIAVKNGQPSSLNRHLKRLTLGCRTLQIAVPDMVVLRQEISQVCLGLRRAVLKILVTRGQSGRGYRPDSSIQPTRLVTVYPWQEYPAQNREQGILATECKTRLSRSTLLAGIKHLNRIEQVMARQEWQDEYQEGLMLDEDGFVIEGTMSNLFLIRDGVLMTPDLNHAGVAGIMREKILSCAETLGINFSVQPLTMCDVQQANSVFISNSLIEIWPVRQIGKINYTRHSYIRDIMAMVGSVDDR
jgi:4-amino-4-deoxychorismate lyase